MYASFLQTIAGIAGTLVGFVGIVFIFGQRTERRLEGRESSGLFHLLWGALGALFQSLLMLIALAEFGDELSVWRAACGITALHIAVGMIKVHFFERPTGANRLQPVIRRGLSVFAACVLALNVVAAAGAAAPAARAAFALAMVLALTVSITYFLAMLTAESKEQGR